ncbi:hypothetical protein ANN_21867 [Periplaneta americana]|uniref:Uncharacterized protein n=1 Tax=Periplaneta americana TaxID=6978 RepID=A0ABQ8S768_PERAM|nr:hypothetical protein ANN_21867 [Periplaneta americana]
MAGLCEGGNEPPGSLKANNCNAGIWKRPGSTTWGAWCCLRSRFRWPCGTIITVMRQLWCRSRTFKRC